MGGCILIYIGICEDREVSRNYIRFLLEEYARRSKLDCEIDAYPDGKAFLAAAKTYDILFLDVIMPGLDGLALGALLRQKNYWTKIIYITGYSKYALSAYDIHAFDYLLKPFKAETFFKKTAEAIQSLCCALPPHKKFIFASRAQTLCFQPEEIYYIESTPRHALQIHTAREIHTVRKTLAEASRMASGCGFAQPHRGFLVNLRHVQKIEGRAIRLDNGFELRIAEKRLQTFKAAFHAYLQSCVCASPT